MKPKKKKRRRRVRYRGKYVSTKMGVQMTYRSGWEQRYFAYLDNNPDVIAFHSEPFKIPYVSNKRSGKARNYIPDILVEYADKKVLVEIKPKRKMGTMTNQKKFEAAKSWCLVNGVEFQIITEVELKVLGLL